MDLLQVIGTYWIHFLCSIISALFVKMYYALTKRIVETEKENMAIKNGVISLLKERINRMHTHYTTLGYCPVAALTSIEMIYAQLDQLEHTETYEKLILDLRNMEKFKRDENGRVIQSDDYYL